MNSFIIRFVGLICHITLGAGTPAPQHYAAMVRDPHGTHSPVLIVSKAVNVTPAGTATFKLISSPTADPLVFDVSNHEISIDGASGAPNLTPDFMGSVMRLSDVTDSSPLSNDAATKNYGSGAITTIFDIPFGDLDAWQVWPRRAHVPHEKKTCAAYTTVFTYTLPSGSDRVKLVSEPDSHGNRLSLTIRADATKPIEFSNEGASGPGHFELYKRLTSADNISLPSLDSCERCTISGHPSPPVGFNNTECSNTQWP